MVPKPNLGGDSIFTLCPVHLKPRHTSHNENQNSLQVLAHTHIVLIIRILRFIFNNASKRSNSQNYNFALKM